MQIVIELSEEDFEKNKNARCDYHTLRMAIKNGIPLPKGHGELIDRDKIEYLKAIHDAKYGHISWSDASKQIKYSAPTIIEADRSEEE